MHPQPILRALWVAALATISLPPVAHAQCVGMGGCTLVWSDEFDGTEVDTSKWEFQIGDGSDYGLPGGWGNNELQYYRSENATVADGELTISAMEEPFGGYAYTSTRIRTLGLGEWTYGRMEMRARLPIGAGMWPAFWMLPSESVYGTWAASGEIDVMEIVGSEPEKLLGSIHYGGAWPANVFTTNDYVLPGGETFHDDFHVFAVEWEEGEIRWYVDDLLYAIETSWYSLGGEYPAPFDRDFHLLLNLAVGGNLPGPPDGNTVFPQEYVVDYVRVYQVDSGFDPGLVFDDFEDGDISDWTFFEGNLAGGGGGVASDRPAQGDLYLTTGWGGEGSQSVFYGGLFRNLDNGAQLSPRSDPYFNAWVYNESLSTVDRYTLEITIREDLDGNGWTDGSEDSFRLDTVFESVDFEDRWVQVSAPFSDFIDLFTGGDGVFNGELDEVVVVISGVEGDFGSTVEVDFDTLQLSSGAPAYGIAVAGECPGPVRLNLAGVAPNGSVGLLFSSAEGSDALVGGPCAGAESGLAQPTLLAVLAADSAGNAELDRTAPAGVCGSYLQAVDADGCVMSPVVRLP